MTNAGLLPYDYTDFAFAAFAEQFGSLGVLILLGLNYAIFSRLVWIGMRSEDNYARLICLGVAMMWGLGVVINIATNIRLLPITGIPFPLLSYGGSAFLANIIGIGLVQMLYVNQTEQTPKAHKLLSDSLNPDMAVV